MKSLKEYIDDRLGDLIIDNLDIIINEINEGKNFKLENGQKIVNTDALDFVGIIIGPAGQGKSTLANLLNFYIDKEYSNDKIFFILDEWNDKKNKLKQGNAINFDELMNMIMSRRGMSKEQIDFINEFVQIRSEGYFTIGCTQSFAMIDKYFKGTRADIVFYVHKEGFVRVYILANCKGDSDEIIRRKELKRQRLMKGEYPPLDRQSGDFESCFGRCDGLTEDKKEIECKEVFDFFQKYAKRKKKHARKEKEDEELIEMKKFNKWLKTNTKSRNAASKYIGEDPSTMFKWEYTIGKGKNKKRYVKGPYLNKRERLYGKNGKKEEIKYTIRILKLIMKGKKKGGIENEYNQDKQDF